MGDGAVAAPTASQRVAGQAPWSILAKVATLTGTLGVSVIAGRLLSTTEFGVLALAKNLVVFGTLAGSLGLDRALLRFVPELEAGGARRGLKALVGIVAVAQVGLLAVWCAVLVAGRPLFERLFAPEIGPLLPLVGLVTAAVTLKETLYQVHFALAKARVLAIATTITGFSWLALTAFLLGRAGGVRGALVAQAVALALAIALLLPSLRRAVDGVADSSPTHVANARLSRYAGTQVGSGLVNLVVQRQSEVYFLAAVAPPAVVGFYDLGYSLPQMGLELLPLSLYAVVMSAVTASYHRDPSRLGHLVGWMYKLLAVTTVPFALLGFVWADKLVALLYGAKMAPAGWIAQAYSLIHLLPFVSLPIGIALNVVEKAHKTLLFGFVQAGVALGLDLLLIPRFKVPGAIAAVLLSVLLVTPVTIWYAVKQTGPLEFPWRWMGRLALVLAPGLLPGLARPWVNGWAGVVACVAASGVLMLLGIRWGGVIGSEERYRLLRAPIPGRRHVLRILGVAP